MAREITYYVMLTAVLSFCNADARPLTPDYSSTSRSSKQNNNGFSYPLIQSQSDYQTLEVQTPMVSFPYKETTYEIGGTCAKIVAKREDLGWGTDALYGREFLKENYQMKINDNVLNRIFSDGNFPDTVVHETIHFLVDQKYGGALDEMSYEDRHFIQEMMAHMGGNKLSEKDAAIRIAENYPKLKNVANEFLRQMNKNISTVAVPDFDTSKLEAQVKKLLSFAQLLVDGGRKISQDQISEHNSYIKGFWEECVVICKKIDALPVPRNEKQRIVKQVGDRVVSTLRPQLEHLDGLMKTAVARGLLEGVELKQLSLTDIQGFIH
jgi:hypothetical protein